MHRRRVACKCQKSEDNGVNYSQVQAGQGKYMRSSAVPEGLHDVFRYVLPVSGQQCLYDPSCVFIVKRYAPDQGFQAFGCLVGCNGDRPLCRDLAHLHFHP